MVFATELWQMSNFLGGEEPCFPLAALKGVIPKGSSVSLLECHQHALGKERGWQTRGEAMGTGGELLGK